MIKHLVKLRWFYKCWDFCIFTLKELFWNIFCFPFNLNSNVKTTEYLFWIHLKSFWMLFIMKFLIVWNMINYPNNCRHRKLSPQHKLSSSNKAAFVPCTKLSNINSHVNESAKISFLFHHPENEVKLIETYNWKFFLLPKSILRLFLCRVWGENETDFFFFFFLAYWAIHLKSYGIAVTEVSIKRVLRGTNEENFSRTNPHFLVLLPHHPLGSFQLFCTQKKSSKFLYKFTSTRKKTFHRSYVESWT